MTKSIELILTFLSEFGKCFSRKIAFYRFSGYVLACILSRNRMTITGIYRFLGSTDALSNLHKFLSRSPWQPEQIFEVLFGLIMKYIYPLQDEADRTRLFLIVDSTVIAKSGEKTDGVDKYYSSTLEKQQKGNEIVRLSLLLKIAHFGFVELPIMCRLYVTEKAIKKQKLDVEYQTREVIGAKMVEKVREWTTVPILLIGDALYSTETTINPLLKLKEAALISRRRNGEKKSGVAWELPDNTSKPLKGRPRKRGKEIRFNDIGPEKFSPCTYLKRGREHSVKVVRFDDVLVRKCALPVTIVVVQEENGNRYVLICTDKTLETSRILELYRLRFQIEFGFRDTKQYLGFGDYQVRKFCSILKHLTISQTAYNLCKMLYVLCDELRTRANAVFYIRDWDNKGSFSMMSLKEELSDDFMVWILGKTERKRLDYISMIFENDRLFGGNYEKILPNNTKNHKTAA